jgi:hypothetical protein
MTAPTRKDIPMTDTQPTETITDPAAIRATDEPDDITTPAPVGAAVTLDLDALHETICDKFTGMAEVRQSADLLLAEVRRLTRWQFEAMSVMAGLQGLGSALGMRLGESITGHAAAEAARALTARAEAAEADAVTLRAKVAAVEAHPVVLELAEERTRQTAKHGDQSHLPDGTGAALWLSMDDDYIRRHGIRRDNLAAWAKARTDEASQASGDGSITFEHILTEEWAEAIAESDPDALRAELVQVAAVAVQWIEAIDLRAALATTREGQ